MAVIPKEIQRLFRRVRDLFILAVFPNAGILKGKFFRFVVRGIRSGEFDFSDLVGPDDLNEFYRRFRELRDEYVEQHYEDILERIGEGATKEELKELPEFLIDYFAAKERFLTELSTLESFVTLPADIRTELFHSSKPLREKMLERLLPITLVELGLDDERIRQLATDTGKKRRFYFERLFPRINENAGAVGLRFDRKLIWRKADELVEGVLMGQKSIQEGGTD